MSNLFDISGRVAIVTGGSRGIGRALSLGLAREGADVVVASRKLDACEKVAEEARSFGRGRALPVSCHVGRWGELEALVEATLREFGKIDILINNAGMAPLAPSMLEVTEALYDSTMGVNLKGPFRLSALVAEQMGKTGGGVIISMSSLASLYPVRNTPVYSPAKAGLNALTSVMAQEFAPKNVRVNCIVVGAFRTDALQVGIDAQFGGDVEAMGRSANIQGRVAEPEEMLGTVLYLCSEASAYVTGQLIVVDGGSKLMGGG